MNLMIDKYTWTLQQTSALGRVKTLKRKGMSLPEVAEALYATDQSSPDIHVERLVKGGNTKFTRHHDSGAETTWYVTRELTAA